MKQQSSQSTDAPSLASGGSSEQSSGPATSVDTENVQEMGGGGNAFATSEMDSEQSATTGQTSANSASSAPPPSTEAEAPAPQSYSCSLGGTAFEVVVPGEGGQVQLLGFSGSFGHLQIESLSGYLSQGQNGPVGSVQGRATVAGSVECSVQGSFSGGSLTLDVLWNGTSALWKGLNLAEFALHVGQSAYGTGFADYDIDGVNGKVALSFENGRFVASTFNTISLPHFGPVQFLVEVNGFDFRFRAETTALSSFKLPRATVVLEHGLVEVVDGALTGTGNGSFTDEEGVITGSFNLEVDGVSTVKGGGPLTIDLPGLATPATGNFQFDSTSASVEFPNLYLDICDGMVTGVVNAAWSTTDGLIFSTQSLTGNLPVGEPPMVVDFQQLSYDHTNGFSGSAAMEFSQLGIDWTDGAMGVSGQLSVGIENNALVGGQGVVGVQFGWGNVDVRLAGWAGGSLVAGLTANINSLGDAVQLDAPLVLEGEYSNGVTALATQGAAFEVALGSSDVSLSGEVGNTSLGPEGFSSDASLTYDGGALGTATGSGAVTASTLSRVDFTFANPQLKYPADNPSIEGSFTGGVSYDAGVFSGDLTGSADFVNMAEREDSGSLAMDLHVDSEGDFSGTVEGSDIVTPILVINSFMVEIVGNKSTGHVMASVRDDLPVNLTGTVNANWDDSGLAASADLAIASDENSSPKLDGSVSLSYHSETGLIGDGRASIILQEGAIPAKAEAGIHYEPGSLVIDAKAATVIESAEPVFDMQAAFGGKSIPLIGEKLEKEHVLPIAGVPYVHGVAAKLAFKFASPTIGGKLSGLTLGADLYPYDILGDDSPVFDVTASLNESSLSLGFSTGFYADIIFTAYGITTGVHADAKLTASLVAANPSFKGDDLTWDEQGNFDGDLDMFVPLRFSMIPSAKFQAPLAGFGKWYTGIPGMKETWVGNEQILKVFEPFEASLPIKAMLGESTSSTDDLGLEDPDHAAMKDAVLSDNPKLKDVVEFLLMAADVFGDMNNEATQHIDHGTEFWSNILTGESLETAQANAHESSRLLVQNSQYSIAIATQHANIKALLGGGMENADPAKLLASYQELHNNLQNLLTNMAYGAGRFGHDFDKDMYLRYDHARKAASKRMQLLMGLG